DYIYHNTYYYLIKVVTFGGVESTPSDVITSYNFGSRIFLVENARLFLPKVVDVKLQTEGYKIVIETQTVSTSELERLRILKKYNIAVDKHGKYLQYNFTAPLIFEVELGNTLSVFGANNNNNNISAKPALFFYNNIEYIYIPSDNIEGQNFIRCSISKTGTYVLREVQPFGPSVVQIYPKKIFTPTATKDNKIHFVISNPTVYQTEGEIYDLNLRYIAKMKLENNELVWDGKFDSGEFAPKGVYIYKIKVGGKIFTGTVIVAK
ncbi:MAG: hypothetical protein N2Z73_02115, partial [Endomicrobia bacterium]|nr:hypothetical protein [Endomicrobiia bacterium]